MRGRRCAAFGIVLFLAFLTSAMTTEAAPRVATIEVRGMV